MRKTLQDILASAQHYRFGNEANLDAFLLERGVSDPEQRIAAKLALAAAGEMATDQAHDDRLATDTARYQPETAPVSREVQAWMRKAGLDVTKAYSEPELDAALSSANLGLMERIAIKTTLRERRQLSAASKGLGRHRMQASRERPQGTRIPGTLHGYSW